MDMIALIEQNLGKKAEIIFKSMQPGDLEKTFADIEYTRDKLNYNPKTTLKEGIPRFIEWYESYNIDL